MSTPTRHMRLSRCARAASGHAAAAPPTSVMNSRRFNLSYAIRFPRQSGPDRSISNYEGSVSGNCWPQDHHWHTQPRRIGPVPIDAWLQRQTDGLIPASPPSGPPQPPAANLQRTTRQVHMWKHINIDPAVTAAMHTPLPRWVTALNRLRDSQQPHRLSGNIIPRGEMVSSGPAALS